MNNEETTALATTEESPQQFVGRHYHELVTLQRALPNYAAIDSDESFNQWGNVLSQVKSYATALRDKKELVTKPLNEALKNYRAMFAPAEDALDKCEAGVRKLLDDWLSARKLAREAEQAKMREGNQTPEEQSATFNNLAALEGAPGGDSTTVRTTWVFDVTDENALPSKYKAVDLSAIRKAVAEGERSIPGVLIYQKQSAAVKAKKGRVRKGEGAE